MKVLPELLKAVEFGGAGAKALAPILKIGGKLNQEEFNSLILPSIVSLFASQDRAIRYSLCENLEGFIKFIPEKVVNDKIFPSLATGFSDVNVIFTFQLLVFYPYHYNPRRLSGNKLSGRSCRWLRRYFHLQ